MSLNFSSGITVGAVIDIISQQASRSLCQPTLNPPGRVWVMFCCRSQDIRAAATPVRATAKCRWQKAHTHNNSQQATQTSGKWYDCNAPYHATLLHFSYAWILKFTLDLPFFCGQVHMLTTWYPRWPKETEKWLPKALWCPTSIL